MSKPNYEIVDFYYNRYGDNSFRTKDDLKQIILADDSKGTAKLWIDNQTTDWYTKEGPGGFSPKDKVDDVNNDYIEKIKRDIEKANTEGELDKIEQSGIYGDRTTYEDDTQSKIEEALKEKKEGFEGPITIEIEGVEYEIPAKFERGRPRAMVSEEVRATAGEIMGEIADAGADNDLDKLRGIEISNLPGQLRRMLERELRETISAVEEELKEKEKP